MKIALVLMDDINVGNGTTARANHLLDVLHDKFVVTLIACSDKDFEYSKKWKDVHIIGIGTMPLRYRSVRFLMKLYYILLWNLNLMSVLVKNGFDAVMSINDPLGFPGLYIASKIKRFKVIYEACAIFSYDVQEVGHSGVLLKLDRILERFVIKHSDFILADSANTMEFYKSYNPKVDVFPVFVDTDVFHSSQRPKRQDRKMIGIIGPFINNIRGQYPLEFLYREVNKFDSRIDFLVIGICNNRIEHQRIKYTGYMESAEYVKCLCSLDAVLVIEVAATSGPLSKIFEPLACSVPVFATPKAMIGLYWIEPGRDILIFPENEIVSKVNEIIFDDMKMDEISKNARAKIEKYYNQQDRGVQIIKILQALTQTRS